MTMGDLAAREIVRGEHQTLDASIAGQRFHDLGQIRQGDASVKVVIGFDENADAAGALVETARLADASAEFRQTARGHLFLQRRADFLGTLRGAGAFDVIIGAAIGADEKITLSQHAGTLAGAR